MKLRLIAFVGVAILASAISAMAQFGRIEGSVKGKGADGKTIPIEGATVDIVRQDIKGSWTVKTNKAGEFVQSGIQNAGLYTLLISAPGWNFTYALDIKVGQPPRNDFELTPGDGRHVTYEELTTALKNRSAATDAKAAEEEKKRAEANKKANENFEAMKKTFEEGIAFYNKGNELSGKPNNFGPAGEQYKLAVDKLKAAVELDSTQHVIYNALAAAAKNLAISKYNTTGKDGAQQDFKDSADASKKAIELQAERTDDKDHAATELNYHEFRAGTLGMIGQVYNDESALKDAIVEWNFLIGKYGSDAKKASMGYTNLGENLVNLTSAVGLEEGNAKRAEAKTAFEKALSLDPKNAKAYIGQVKMIAGDPSADVVKFKEAVELAKKAKSISDPTSADFKTADAFIKDLETTITTMEEEAKKAADKGNTNKKKKP